LDDIEQCLNTLRCNQLSVPSLKELKLVAILASIMMLMLQLKDLHFRYQKVRPSILLKLMKVAFLT
jgi:hypothetical protein